jgi:GAF domain-containing protein
MDTQKHIKAITATSTEQPYMQTVLYITLVTFSILAGAITVLGLLMEMQKIELGASTVLVFCVLMLLFTSQNKLWVPRLLVPTITYAVTTYLVFTNNAIHDILMLVYPITILLAGMLIGETGVILYTFIVTVTVAIGGYADIHYLLSPEISHYGHAGNVAILAILSMVTGAILYVTIHSLNMSLAQVQHSEAELTQRNQELESISASLEQQVAERSRNAEKAKEDAENANRALERRMWLFTGITHMSDLMRGEQNVETLAHNIIHGLCEYMDVPIGAIYIFEDNVLTFVSGYAFPLDNSTIPLNFAIGEGILGQAALEQRIIKLNDVPADYVAITSGMGKAPPRHMLAVPIMNQNRLVGVIEIGSFDELYPHHIQFIESVLQDIGIAFSTAQARARIDELLRETQQMAEELQAQEEELRAANEELEVQTERLRESYQRLEQQVDLEDKS